MNTNNTYKAKKIKALQAKRPIKYIVLHDTAGNGGIGDVRYLANDPENRGVSVDFVIPKDGTIYQLNHDLEYQYTYHAGRKTFFRGDANGMVNKHSIGIEIGQKANLSGLDPIYPDIQVRAVADLCRYLCETFNLTKTDITTHSKIITDGSRSDPRKFPWDDFWKYFNQEDDPTVVPCGDNAIYHTVKKGDTLYSLSVRYLSSVERIKALNNMNTASNLISVGQILKVKE